jgi:hypothetical protein
VGNVKDQERPIDPPYEDEPTEEQKELNDVLESIAETEARESWLERAWREEK